MDTGSLDAKPTKVKVKVKVRNSAKDIDPYITIYNRRLALHSSTQKAHSRL